MHKRDYPTFPASLEPSLLKLRQELEAPWPPIADPYWPKWDHLWWKLTFLLETGQIKLLKKDVFERFADLLNAHYLPFFPLTEAELPPQYNQSEIGQHIFCHCALGTAIQILQAGDLDPWKIWPWLSDWLQNYQLPDGGYNCDEQVYTGSKRSSLVSTLPLLQAWLNKPDLSTHEQELLKQGIQSLLKRKLFQTSQGQVIDPLWLQPLFPRFYNYDILRALNCICQWSLQTQEKVKESDLRPALEQLESQGDNLQAQTWYPAQDKTLWYDPETGKWQRGKQVNLFPLLRDFIAGGFGSGYSQVEWRKVKANLAQMQTQSLLE
jgi:hypothetical protein